MKVDKFRLEDLFPSQDGSLKLILIDREDDKHILHYPKSHKHVYLNDMYFFMNQGYIVLDNDCVPVNPVILTDNMVGKQVQLLNGKVYTVHKYTLDSHYKIGDYIYDCFGHGRVMPTERTTISPDYRVKYVIPERGTNYFSKHVVVDLKAYNKLKENLVKIIILKETENAKANLKTITKSGKWSYW